MFETGSRGHAFYELFKSLMILLAAFFMWGWWIFWVMLPLAVFLVARDVRAACLTWMQTEEVQKR